MQITLIAAVDKNLAIGKGNQLPWHLPKDLQFFKASTLGHPVVLGRKTFESFGSKPLPKRTHYIISSSLKSVDFEQCVICPSVTETLIQLKKQAYEQVFIIGGGNVYEQFLPFADELILTHVDTEIEEAEVFFPQPVWNQYKSEEIMQIEKDENHAYFCSVKRYTKFNV